MSDERKPSEDFKEGLSLIFRAARSAAKQVDVSKIDKGLDKAITQATRVATNVGRAVADEINRMSTNQSPPWQSNKPDDTPPKDEGEGQVWASEAQSTEERADEPDRTKVRVETDEGTTKD